MGVVWKKKKTPFVIMFSNNEACDFVEQTVGIRP